jgi:hypothetical protein
MFGVTALFLLMLSACDSRGEDVKPEMDLTVVQSQLVNSLDSLNYCDIHLQLTCKESFKTTNQIVNITCDDTNGTLIGSGSSDIVRTDSTGAVDFQFRVSNGFFGTLNLEATMENYASVHDAISLPVLDCPEITYAAIPDTLQAGSGQQVPVVITVTSHSANFAQEDLTLETPDGLSLSTATLRTDDNGQATVIATAPIQPGIYYITARMVRYHPVYENIPLNFQ